MIITAEDLDNEIKENLRTTIMRGLLKTYGTLPLPAESEKILAVVGSGATNKLLDERVTDYYKDFSKNDVSVNISPDMYMKIYLRYL